MSWNTHLGDMLEPLAKGEQPNELAQKHPQVPEDHADVVPAAAQDREDGVAGRSLQRASGQAAVVLHVANHRLDGASSSQQFRDGPGDAASRTADEDLHGLDAVAAVSAIDEGHVRARAGQDLNLFQRFVQSVAVVGIAGQRCMPTTKPPLLVVATLTFVPNS